MLADAIPCKEIMCLPQLKSGANNAGKAMIRAPYSVIANRHRGTVLMTSQSPGGPVFEALDYSASKAWNSSFPFVSFQNAHVLTVRVGSSGELNMSGSTSEMFKQLRKAPGMFDADGGQEALFTITFLSATMSMVTTIDVNTAIRR
jgi:hypothetical protein